MSKSEYLETLNVRSCEQNQFAAEQDYSLLIYVSHFPAHLQNGEETPRHPVFIV
jgi:hypothetical protein